MTGPKLNVLLSLAGGRTHGYRVMLEASERTGGRVSIGAGTLYACLKRMVGRGVIEELEHHGAQDGAHRDRRRYYELTRPGEEVLVAELKLMQSYTRTGQERNVGF